MGIGSAFSRAAIRFRLLFRLPLSQFCRGNEKSHLKSVRVTEQAGRSAGRAMRHRNPGLRLSSTDSNGTALVLRSREEEFNLCKSRERERVGNVLLYRFEQKNGAKFRELSQHFSKLADWAVHW